MPSGREDKIKADNNHRHQIKDAVDAEYIFAGNDDFAAYTIETRFPKVYKDNNLGAFDIDKVVDFSKNDFLKITPGRYVDQQKEYSRLVSTFLTWLSPYSGMKTKEFYYSAPFILVEHYFYFDILRGLESRKDPYLGSKIKALREYRGDFSRLVAEYVKGGINPLQDEAASNVERIRSGINNCMYGNTTDLSLATSKRRSGLPEMIRDDTEQFLTYMKNNRLSKIDILVDNSGIELLADMILALKLIDCGYAKNVHLHTKVLPVFVSDVIASEYGDDVVMVVNEVNGFSREMHEKLLEYVEEGRIVVKPDLFWNMPNDFKNYHDLFRRIVGGSDLIIIKGDLNFRRLIEDKTWDSELELDRAVSYFTYPLLVLRMIKSSTVIDISEKEREKIGIIDKANGAYGTILFKE